MKVPERGDQLVRRLAAAIRSASLYAPEHPIVRCGVTALAQASHDALRQADTIVFGLVGDEVVVDGVRLRRSSGALSGFSRDLREQGIEKIVFARGVGGDELRTLVVELARRDARVPVADRLDQCGFRHVSVGRIVLEDPEEQAVGIAAARRVYQDAVTTAETLWSEAKAREHPDPAAAQRIIDSMARLVAQDRTSLMALTALKKYDNYTFTHMVNVSVLSMAQARALNLQGAMLREFGFAALMHDIGKVNTPLDVLNKPDRLTNEEFEIMKRHVIDGAHILRRTPEMPALAPVVAFEHHLKQDLSGYPQNIGHRKLNLCTMIVSIADVFDALRSNRIYREGLSTERVKAILAQKDSPAFHPTLLRRFIKLVGLFPVGTLVRLSTDELGVVTHEHPTDPFRPQVKVLQNARGEPIEEPFLVNTWDEEARTTVVEAVDPETVALDPLTFL